MMNAKDKKVIDAHGRYLDEGMGLSQEEHEIREQAYKADTIIKDQEVEVGNLGMKLKEHDIIEILYALAKWGNKQDGNFWDEQTSY